MAEKVESLPIQDIFISYRREDGTPAGQVYSYLRRLGYDVFWDVELQSKKLPNNEFPPVLEEQIKNCRDFILIISDNTFRKDEILRSDDWIRREVRLALENDRNIVAFSLSGTTIPKEEDLPPELRALVSQKQINPYPIEPSRRTDQEICAALMRHLESSRIGGAGKGGEASMYTSVSEEERVRLELQARNTLAFDEQVLNEILKENPDKNFTVLDVGCAWGFVGLSRFAGDRYTKVVGIDREEKCINFAVANAMDQRLYKFHYGIMDLEVDRGAFKGALDRVLQQAQVPDKQVDIIFASLVLHHLQDPVACISRLRSYLKPGGYFIIRGSDDQTKIAGSDEDNKLVREIMDFTSSVSGMADRRNGSKIYGWLYGAGFKDVKIYSNMRDTSRMDPDERLDLFEESFSWRLELYEEGIQKTNRYRKLKTALDKLQIRFTNPSFWYCGYDYIGVGKKE